MKGVPGSSSNAPDDKENNGSNSPFMPPRPGQEKNVRTK
jgi:hypothetical protein